MRASTPLNQMAKLPLPKGQYSDIVLAFGVVAIVALMILPLPLFVIDALVAVNILISVSLVLLSIYVPTPLAFSSFPSVILLTTLFRLSLSIAITRLILLDADAGHIIETFGNMVVGGNLVVGIVVFLIITVVQFIVIAKGAERVAEVAARFTLDAMPGKQLSIDSDLRAGLIDKEDARDKRRSLEKESQLHGALDGAMKFVKGDAIAGIVILIVNILGGLTVGMLQRDMSLGDAVHTYSVLTIGDGLISQIPALLTSIAAGLIITRTGGDNSEQHLGSAIGRQFSAFPRVFLIGGILALVLMLVPGFPWPVFLILGLALIGGAIWKNPPSFIKNKLPMRESDNATSSGDGAAEELPLIKPPAALALHISKPLLAVIDRAALENRLSKLVAENREKYGVPMPLMSIVNDDLINAGGYEVYAHGIRIGKGALELTGEFALHKGSFLIPGRYLPNTDLSEQGEKIAFLPELTGTWHHQGQLPEDSWQLLSIEKLLEKHVSYILRRHMSGFLGIQEASDMINHWALTYPDLVKETLRVIPPQRLTDAFKQLLQEGLSIRNLRDLFEVVTDVGSREKDMTLLIERVRQGLKQQISHHFADDALKLNAIMIHPDLEQTLRDMYRNQQANGNVGNLSQEFYANLSDKLQSLLQKTYHFSKPAVLLCSSDVRRFVRQLVEEDFYFVPVLAYQELVGNVQIVPLGHIN